MIAIMLVTILVKVVAQVAKEAVAPLVNIRVKVVARVVAVLLV